MSGTPTPSNSKDKNTQRLGSLFDSIDLTSTANKPRDVTLGGSQKVKFAPTIPARRSKKAESTSSLLEPAKSSEVSQQPSTVKPHIKRIEQVVTVTGPVSGIFSAGPSATGTKSKRIGGVSAASFHRSASDSSSKAGSKYSANSDFNIGVDEEKAEEEIKFIDQSIPEPPVYERLFLTDNENHQNELFLIQMESLPLMKIQAATEKMQNINLDDNPEGSSAVSNKSENADAKNSVDLNEYLAGNLGKLRMRKSGNIDLVIGNVTYKLQRGSYASFMQSVSAIDEENGQVFDLGPIRERFCCMPLIEFQ